jgi:predicted outer membrane protein
MKARIFALALALVALPATVRAQLAEGDLQIVSYLHSINQIEMDAGQLAQLRGTTPMQQLGATLVIDHTAADQRLLAYARHHGLSGIPVEAPDPDHAPIIEAQQNLSQASGRDFDAMFLGVVPDAQSAELKYVEDAIARVADPELEQILRDFELVLKSHEIEIGNFESYY